MARPAFGTEAERTRSAWENAKVPAVEPKRHAGFGRRKKKEAEQPRHFLLMLPSLSGGTARELSKELSFDSQSVVSPDKPKTEGMGHRPMTPVHNDRSTQKRGFLP